VREILKILKKTENFPEKKLGAKIETETETLADSDTLIAEVGTYSSRQCDECGSGRKCERECLAVRAAVLDSVRQCVSGSVRQCVL